MGKKKHRTWTDACSLYGVDVSRVERCDYERFLALHLNRIRSTCRQGYAIQLGISAGLGKHIGKSMGLSWYLAIAESEDEARLLYEKAMVSE